MNEWVVGFLIAVVFLIVVRFVVSRRNKERSEGKGPSRRVRGGERQNRL